MAQFYQLPEYDHIRKEYSRLSTSKILDKLIQEMHINDLKSRSILKLEDKIEQLETMNRTKGISLTEGKKNKLEQLKEAYDNRHSHRQSATPKQSPRRQYRDLSSARNPQNDETHSPKAGKHRQQLISSLQQSTRTIADLSFKNQTLQGQLNELKQDIGVLVNTHEMLRNQIIELKKNQQFLVNQNNELTLDCRYQIDQYSKSVEIIEKLLEQLEEFKILHCQKSQVIKDMTSNNNNLQENIQKYIQSMDQYSKSVDVYEKKTKELLENEVQYEEQIKRLLANISENQAVIQKLEIQNEKMRDDLQGELRNGQILDQVMKEMRERTHVLEKKVLMLEASCTDLQSILKNKENEMFSLYRSLQQCDQKLALSQKENVLLKQQFKKTTEEFRQQVNKHLKLINGYEKMQKPKQLSTLKQKFKGEEKPKQFKLNAFNMKMNTEKSIIMDQDTSIRGEDDKIQRDQRSKRLKTTSEGLRGIVLSIEQKMNQLLGTHSKITEKTTQLNKKFPQNTID